MPERPSHVAALSRGWRKRCPMCGEGPLFDRWYTLQSSCNACAYDFRDADSHTWAFMYMSTAFCTGLVIVGMLLMTPTNIMVGRAVVLLAGFALIVGTLPRRKGLGIAVDYLLTRPSSPPAGEPP